MQTDSPSSSHKGKPRWQRWLHPDIRATLATDPANHSPIVSRGYLASFRYALAGFLYMLRYQKNTRIQALASLLALSICIWLQIPARDVAVIVLAITLNWMTEFINASLEAAINLASPEIHPLARVGKDVAAATALLTALSSALIGLLILGPPLAKKLGGA